MFTNFLSLNLPYGMKKNSNGEWSVFNREYLPLGFNDITLKEEFNNEKDYGLPIYTAFKGITDLQLRKIVGNNKIDENDEGEITRVWFFEDSTKPTINKKYMADYLKILESLSKFEIKKKHGY